MRCSPSYPQPSRGHCTDPARLTVAEMHPGRADEIVKGERGWAPHAPLTTPSFLPDAFTDPPRPSRLSLRVNGMPRPVKPGNANAESVSWRPRLEDDSSSWVRSSSSSEPEPPEPSSDWLLLRLALLDRRELVDDLAGPTGRGA